MTLARRIDDGAADSSLVTAPATRDLRSVSTLPSIQSLRALAALMVLGFHLSQWTGFDFRIGQAGVDLFFVISGVVMWRSTSERSGGSGAFQAARAVRILPPYWIATGGLLALELLAPDTLDHLHPEAGHIALSLLLIPHLDPEGLPFPFLSQGWTLAYEAVFYGLIAIGLLLAPARRLTFLTTALVILALAGLAWPPAYGLIANPLMLEFLAGVWLARLLEARALPGPAMAWALIGLGVAAFASLAFIGFYNDLLRPWLWGPPAILIVGGAVALEQARTAPRLAPLEMLGDASYSLYLWHTLAAALVSLLISERSWAFVPAAAAAAIAAAFASRALIEGPALKASRALAARARRP